LLVSVNSIIHDFSRGDLRDVHVSEEGHQVNARPQVLALDVLLTTFSTRHDLAFA
jgi:hypothetical protein